MHVFEEILTTFLSLVIPSPNIIISSLVNIFLFLLSILLSVSNVSLLMCLFQISFVLSLFHCDQSIAYTPAAYVLSLFQLISVILFVSSLTVICVCNSSFWFEQFFISLLISFFIPFQELCCCCLDCCGLTRTQFSSNCGLTDKHFMRNDGQAQLLAA